MPHLTAIVLTYNEAAHIVDCIESLQFSDSVLVFDSFSTDDTVPLARAADAEVKQRRFENYADQRNSALEVVKAKTDWVLFVDADERVSPELARELRRVIDNPGSCVGFGIPRHNYIFGKLTRGAGWYPDYQTRLLKLGSASYDPERKVHEVVVLDGDLCKLKHPLIHYNYRDVYQFAAKQRKYTAYEAQILFEQGIRPKAQNYVLQPLRHLRWRFFELGGYKDGLHGLRLSFLMGWYEFKKYLILRELWRKEGAA